MVEPSLNQPQNQPGYTAVATVGWVSDGIGGVSVVSVALVGPMVVIELLSGGLVHWW